MKNSDHTAAPLTENDSEELERFGYSQQLKRMMGGASEGWAVVFITLVVMIVVTMIHLSGIRMVSYRV